MLELNRGLSLIREAQESVERQRFEAKWIAWGKQIQQRTPVEVA